MHRPANKHLRDVGVQQKLQKTISKDEETLKNFKEAVASEKEELKELIIERDEHYEELHRRINELNSLKASFRKPPRTPPVLAKAMPKKRRVT